MRLKDEMEIQSNEKKNENRQDYFRSISTHRPIKTCVNIEFSSLAHRIAFCVAGFDFGQRNGQTREKKE